MPCGRPSVSGGSVRKRAVPRTAAPPVSLTLTDEGGRAPEAAASPRADSTRPGSPTAVRSGACRSPVAGSSTEAPGSGIRLTAGPWCPWGSESARVTMTGAPATKSSQSSSSSSGRRSGRADAAPAAGPAAAPGPAALPDVKLGVAEGTTTRSVVAVACEAAAEEPLASFDRALAELSPWPVSARRATRAPLPPCAGLLLPGADVALAAAAAAGGGCGAHVPVRAETARGRREDSCSVTTAGEIRGLRQRSSSRTAARWEVAVGLALSPRAKARPSCNPMTSPRPPSPHLCDDEAVDVLCPQVAPAPSVIVSFPFRCCCLSQCRRSSSCGGLRCFDLTDRSLESFFTGAAALGLSGSEGCTFFLRDLDTCVCFIEARKAHTPAEVTVVSCACCSDA
jgi:hypothetical protein